MDLQVDPIQNRPLAKALGNIFKFYDGWIHQSTSDTAKRSTKRSKKARCLCLHKKSKSYIVLRL
jgi:hypothetical protein